MTRPVAGHPFLLIQLKSIFTAWTLRVGLCFSHTDATRSPCARVRERARELIFQLSLEDRNSDGDRNS